MKLIIEAILATFFTSLFGFAFHYVAKAPASERYAMMPWLLIACLLVGPSIIIAFKLFWENWWDHNGCATNDESSQSKKGADHNAEASINVPDRQLIEIYSRMMIASKTPNNNVIDQSLAHKIN